MNKLLCRICLLEGPGEDGPSVDGDRDWTLEAEWEVASEGFRAFTWHGNHTGALILFSLVSFSTC